MGGEFGELDPLLGKVCQFEETFLELSGFLAVFVKLSNFLLADNLGFEPSFDNVPPNIFHAVNEKILQIALFKNIVDILRLLLAELSLQPFKSKLLLCDGVVVIGFQCLNVVENLILDVLFFHARLKNEIDELLELDVFSWNFAITALDVVQVLGGFVPVVSYGSTAFSRLKRLAHTSSPRQSMLLVLHEILLDQSLTILNRIHFDLLCLLVNIGTR